MMEITRDIQYVGVNDYEVDLFEGMYVVPNGMAYNSYVIMDEKIAILDTVDEGFLDTWLMNIRRILDNQVPDYLIVQHMEPDHSAGIIRLIKEYPGITVVASERAFVMMMNYFGNAGMEKRMVITEGDTLSLGTHELIFASAMMVHWPEVMVTYDKTDKVFFSADAFGKFGALNAKEEWVDEARRYYIGIVGKYGIPVQKLLDKASDWDIKMICPLHGPVLKENISYYLEKYRIWSGYIPEEEGILIAYTSIYGNTKQAVFLLEEELKNLGYQNVVIKDLARDDRTEVVADAFRYSKLVLATTTYNVGLFPFMRDFIHYLTDRNFSNRKVAFIENGSWMPIAEKLMKDMLKDCKDLCFAKNTVKIISALNEENILQIKNLAKELSEN